MKFHGAECEPQNRRTTNRRISMGGFAIPGIKKKDRQNPFFLHSIFNIPVIETPDSQSFFIDQNGSIKNGRFVYQMWC